jgi:hypothetical protein
MATNILFCYNNLYDAATITASSAASGYPVANLKNQIRSKVWKTAGATAGTANLVINHGSAKAVTVVALTGYDWASAPGTLNFDADAAATFNSGAGGAPQFSQALTWAANPTANGNKATILKTFASHSYQYNRLNVVYSPGATPTDWQLGRIFVGTYFQPTRNYLYERRDTLVDPSFVSQTVGGQRYVDEVEKYRIIDFSFYFNGQSQWESFMAMLNTVGTAKDLFIAFDYDNEVDEMTIYGKFATLPQASITRNRAFDLTFEESR